jgi:hypothetical protein
MCIKISLGGEGGKNQEWDREGKKTQRKKAESCDPAFFL